MGIVSLPSMDDIQQQKDPKQQMEMLINTLGILMKELGEINGYLGGANIRANSITAQKLDVEELSAISANMGKLTSGEIYGAYIATAEGVYPLAEMSNTNDLFGVYASAAKYLRMIALDGSTSAPTIIFQDSTIPITVTMYLDTSLNEFNIGSTKNIRFSSGLSGYTRLDGDVRVGNWSNLYSIGASQTLQAALNAKQNSFSGFTGTIYVATTSGGSPTTAKTFVNGVCTS